MAELRTLIRAQSGYGSWEYGQSVAPATLGAAVNGAAEDVEVSGLVPVGAGSVTLTTPYRIVGTNANARFTDASFFFAFGGSGGGFHNLRLDTYPVEFKPTSSAQVITNTHLATGFWGILEGVEMTDVTIGQCAGNLSDRQMRWQGSNNTFLRCSDTHVNNKFSSFDAFLAISITGYGLGKQKSFTGNRFIDCQASAYEEIFGFDSLPVMYGVAVVRVTSVDGYQVGFSIVRNQAGYEVTTDAAIGMHVAFLTGDGARRYHPIVGRSGSTYELGQSRLCKTVYGVEVGDYALMGPIWADNDYEGCTAYVNYEVGPSQSPNDGGFEFPNTAFSMFGLCFGNIIQENVCVRHPNESVPISQLVSGPKEDWYEGCNFGRPVYGYSESAFVFQSIAERPNISGFNRVIDNDFGDLTSAMGSGSLRNDTWSSGNYDNVKPPYMNDCGGGLVYGGETAFVGNTYPSSDQQIFTLIGNDAYGQRGWFESPQPQRTALQGSKNVVWRGNSALPNTRWQSHHNLRWWPDENWNPTNPVRKPVWGAGIPGSTPASPLGGQSETTWSDGSPRATILQDGHVEVRFYRESEALERSVNGGVFTPVGDDIDPTLYLDTDISEGGSYVYRIGTVESEAVEVPWLFDFTLEEAPVYFDFILQATVPVPATGDAVTESSGSGDAVQVQPAVGEGLTESFGSGEAEAIAPPVLFDFVLQATVPVPATGDGITMSEGTGSADAINEGFAVGTGITDSVGSGSAAQVQPAAGSGMTDSVGTGDATPTNIEVIYADGAGITYSTGEGIATVINPAQGTGTTVSAGVGIAAQVQPATGTGTTISRGWGDLTPPTAQGSRPVPFKTGRQTTAPVTGKQTTIAVSGHSHVTQPGGRMR